MKRHAWAPIDDSGRALLWRHQRVMRLLEPGHLPADPADLLLAVVAPSPEMLEVSLAAVREREQAVA